MKNKHQRASIIAIVLLGVSGCSCHATLSEDIQDRPKDGVQVSATQPEALKQALAEWLAYRVQRGEVTNRNSYAAGFKKGFEESAGFVDGFSDYNLCHSDGMRAQLGESPQQ